MEAEEVYSIVREYIETFTFLELYPEEIRTPSRVVYKNSDGFVIGLGISLSLNGEKTCSMVIHHSHNDFENSYNTFFVDSDIEGQVDSALRKSKYFLMRERDHKIDNALK